MVIFPVGFNKEAADKNSKAGSNIISMESSERDLLNRLMIELHKLDSDIWRNDPGSLGNNKLWQVDSL